MHQLIVVFRGFFKLLLSTWDTSNNKIYQNEHDVPLCSRCWNELKQWLSGMLPRMLKEIDIWFIKGYCYCQQAVLHTSPFPFFCSLDFYKPPSFFLKVSVAWCFTISSNNTGNYHYNHQQTAFSLGFTIIITEVTQTPAKTVRPQSWLDYDPPSILVHLNVNPSLH